MITHKQLADAIRDADTAKQADAVRDAAERLAREQSALSAQTDRLNACIVRFEAWIGSLPGRVETTLGLPDPTPEENPPGLECELLVRLRREGKDWQLVWAFVELGDESSVNWKPLREAGVDIKLYVIPQLPKLVTRMADSQEELKRRVDAVASSFEEFTRTAGIGKETK